MNFSDIALAKFLQTAPELGSYILTFQDMSGEVHSEAGISVGAFVLRCGQEPYYVPVVAKGDSPYPIDSVFSVTKNKFSPLTKNTINDILSASQVSVGKSAKIPTTVIRNPSVYGLITPPRTGKYAFASSSRFFEFLSSMPDHLKSALQEKLTSEKVVYEGIDKLFGLETFLSALKPVSSGAAAKTQEAPLSIVTGGANLPTTVVERIAEDGYALLGDTSNLSRVAVGFQSYNATGTTRVLGPADADRDFDIAFANCPAREAFIPRMHRLNGPTQGILAVFTNGDYAISKSMITVGNGVERKQVLDRLFSAQAPILLREVVSGQKFLLMTADGEFIGPLTANSVVNYPASTEIKVSTNSSTFQNISAHKSFSGRVEILGTSLVVPENTAVILLREDVVFNLERSVNAAAARQELEMLHLLPEQLNLAFDGCEYAVNGRRLGGIPEVMEVLVIKEGIAPDQARAFVKEASEKKTLKVLMSKKANASTDASPAEIPAYGQVPSDRTDIGLNGGVRQELPQQVEETFPLGDPQVSESMILSELLQCPDLFDMISEYLPDIEDAIDKLGRILFTCRVKIEDLASVSDADSVFSMLAQLKNVYRLLGDNYYRLAELVASSQNFSPEGREQF